MSDKFANVTALSSAPTFCKRRTLEPEFLDRFDGTIVLLGEQQDLPAIGQTQPKFTIVFGGSGGEASTLLNLFLKEFRLCRAFRSP
jgi:hypothetical protein